MKLDPSEYDGPTSKRELTNLSMQNGTIFISDPVNEEQAIRDLNRALGLNFVIDRSQVFACPGCQMKLNC